MNLRVAAPAGAQGALSDVILAARTRLSSLLRSLVPRARIASSLREALWALSHWPALR